jgi:hypothetical protein
MIEEEDYDDGDHGAIVGMNDWQRNPKNSEEISLSAAVSTTNPICIHWD